MYRTAHRNRSVLTHIYAELQRGMWRWRSADDIRRRVMVYYYRPTEEMVQGLGLRKHCSILHIYEENASGIDVRVDAAESIAAGVGTELAQTFPNNSIVYSKIGGQVNYRIAVRFE